MTISTNHAPLRRFQRIEVDWTPARPEATNPAPHPSPVVSPPVVAPVSPLLVTAAPITSERERNTHVVRDEDRTRIEAQRTALATIGIDVGAKAATVYTEGENVNAIGVANALALRKAHEALPFVPDACRGIIRTIRAEDRLDVTCDLRAATVDERGRLHVGGGQPPILIHGLPSLRALCERMGLGGKPVDLLNQIPSAIFADVMNDRLAYAPAAPTVIRTRAGQGGEGREAFGFASESYSLADLNEIADRVMNHAPERSRATIAYDRATTRALIDVELFTPLSAESFAVGEVFQIGVRVRSLDVPGGSVVVDVYVKRNRCRNVIVIGTVEVNEGRVRHVGADRIGVVDGLLASGFAKLGAHGAGFVEAWGYALRDTVQPREIGAKVDGRKARGKAKLATATEAKSWADCSTDERVGGLVRGLGTTGGLPTLGEDAIAQVVQCYWRDEVTGTREITRAGVVNAVTRYAHEGSGMDAWTADALERAAGGLTWAQGPMAFQHAYVQRAA